MEVRILLLQQTLTNKTMSDFITRLQTELTDLDEKISKLEPFMSTETFKELNRIDQILLEKQLEVMLDYSRVLNARLMRLTRG